MISVKFTPFAKQEIKDAVNFYEQSRKGLGRSFKDELKKATIRIAEYPED